MSGHGSKPRRRAKKQRSQRRSLRPKRHRTPCARRTAIADELKVEAGYETALGAALGDDLEASSDAGAPLHWAGPIPSEGDPSLPDGALPLSRYVAGSALLKRRLDQIGFVDKTEGARLQAQLRPGQRLVSKGGDQ